jgi:hypothetical protein
MAKGQDSKESTPEPAPRKKVPMAGDLAGVVVRWSGAGNFRRLTRANFAAVGVDHDDVEWWRDPPLNDVPVSQLNLDPAEFNRCIMADRDFQIVKLGD